MVCTCFHVVKMCNCCVVATDQYEACDMLSMVHMGVILVSAFGRCAMLTILREYIVTISSVSTDITVLMVYGRCSMGAESVKGYGHAFGGNAFPFLWRKDVITAQRPRRTRMLAKCLPWCWSLIRVARIYGRCALGMEHHMSFVMFSTICMDGSRLGSHGRCTMDMESRELLAVDLNSLDGG